MHRRITKKALPWYELLLYFHKIILLLMCVWIIFTSTKHDNYKWIKYTILHQPFYLIPKNYLSNRKRTKLSNNSFLWKVCTKLNIGSSNEIFYGVSYPCPRQNYKTKQSHPILWLATCRFFPNLYLWSIRYLLNYYRLLFAGCSLVDVNAQA